MADAQAAVVDADGTQYWHNKEGELHRDGDLPAVVKATGTQQWRKEG